MDLRDFRKIHSMIFLIFYTTILIVYAHNVKSLIFEKKNRYGGNSLEFFGLFSKAVQ